MDVIKLLRLLLKVTEVTTEHPKLPKVSKNSFVLLKMEQKVSYKNLQAEIINMVQNRPNTAKICNSLCGYQKSWV